MNYKTIFDEANKIEKASLARTKLNETLIDAKIDDLDNFLEKHPEEKQILNTPTKDLEDTKYKYLANSLFRKKNPNKTLYGIIQDSINADSRMIIPYFSVDSGGNLKGFVALMVSGDVIYGIKMFSFNADKLNPTIAGDLKELLPQLIEKYSSISWDAEKENPANIKYKALTTKYGGTSRDYIDEETKDECVLYTIPGKKKSD